MTTACSASKIPILVLFLTLIAPGRAPAVQLSYNLHVLGVPIAGAVLTVEMSPSAYSMTVRYRTTGLVQYISSDSLDQKVRGGFDGDRPVPLEYRSVGYFRGMDRLIGLAYRDGIPSVTAISPPNTGEREEVPADMRPGTLDPLSTILAMVRSASSTGRCDGVARDFDGRRLEAFEMRTIGYEDIPSSGRSSFAGRALRCDFTSRVLAGFRIGKDRADDRRDRHGTIWLAQPPEASHRVPVRAAIETRWLGDATIYLTSAAR